MRDKERPHSESWIDTKTEEHTVRDRDIGRKWQIASFYCISLRHSVLRGDGVVTKPSVHFHSTQLTTDLGKETTNYLQSFNFSPFSCNANWCRCKLQCKHCDQTIYNLIIPYSFSSPSQWCIFIALWVLLSNVEWSKPCVEKLSMWCRKAFTWLPDNRKVKSWQCHSYPCPGDLQCTLISRNIKTTDRRHWWNVVRVKVISYMWCMSHMEFSIAHAAGNLKGCCLPNNNQLEKKLFQRPVSWGMRFAFGGTS